jgi:hypothetical protein
MVKTLADFTSGNRVKEGSFCNAKERFDFVAVEDDEEDEEEERVVDETVEEEWSVEETGSDEKTEGAVVGRETGEEKLITELSVLANVKREEPFGVGAISFVYTTEGSGVREHVVEVVVIVGKETEAVDEVDKIDPEV